MNIKAPKNPLPKGYQPMGGQPHRVQNGDSWWSLATRAQVDPWWLIQYNFETQDPSEVNWYLQNRIGCATKTPDGKNFKFSSAAKPGIIHLPSAQTARSLKNLTFGKFGISIEGSKDYQMQVKTTLNGIATSDTGMVLFDALKRAGKEITISPWVGTDCNATDGALGTQDATAEGYPVYVGGGSFKTLEEPSLIRDLLGIPKEPMLGTGKGSDVSVHFSPSMFGYGTSGACASFAGKPGASPSQVLFHELAHAYRQSSGKFNRRPTIGTSVGYTDMEEFFAVVLSNVMISDPTYSTGNRTLRADHAGFNPLAPALSTSKGFVSHIPNRTKMRELAASEPDLCKALRGIQSYFNPFAEAL